VQLHLVLLWVTHMWPTLTLTANSARGLALSPTSALSLTPKLSLILVPVCSGGRRMIPACTLAGGSL
jgi:hypothetical protein